MGTSLSCSLVLLQLIKSSAHALSCGFQSIDRRAHAPSKVLSEIKTEVLGGFIPQGFCTWGFELWRFVKFPSPEDESLTMPKRASHIEFNTGVQGQRGAYSFLVHFLLVSNRNNCFDASIKTR